MTNTPEENAFERGLNAQSHIADNDLGQFASRIKEISREPLTEESRRAMWSTVVAGTSAAGRAAPGNGPIGQPAMYKRSMRSSGILPQGLPAPAVLFLGIAMAIVFAVTGIGRDGGDMVTPTVRAEQAATEVATPSAAMPTVTVTSTEAIDGR